MGLLDSTTQQEYYQGNDYGNYQFTSLEDIINQFLVAYVGEDKIIPKVKRVDVAFHAQRAMQELSFDTFKSIKSQEITLPPSNTMILPQDYVNYTKISYVDSAGIKHLLYPTSKTSNPTPILQNSDGEYALTAIGDLDDSSSDIVLDGEYKNIRVGMIVSGPYIPTDDGITTTTTTPTPITCVVVATSNAGGITTITIGYFDSGVQTAILPIETNVNTTLTFTNVNNSLMLEEEAVVIVEDLDWNTTDFKITANAATDITDVKVGMLVSHDFFPIGTTVTNVDNVTIVVSDLPDTEVLTNLGEITFISTPKDSTTWTNYKSATPSENQDDYQDDTYWPMDGSRFGLDPQHAQANGSFYIDCVSGKIHFSSNIAGKTVILDYISDSLGTDEEMQVHKFAEEAMYKCIAYAILSTSSSQLHQQIAPRFKKEKFAATRQAKLRLSNIKLEELTQILRGKSKQIKH